MKSANDSPTSLYTQFCLNRTRQRLPTSGQTKSATGLPSSIELNSATRAKYTALLLRFNTSFSVAGEADPAFFFCCRGSESPPRKPEEPLEGAVGGDDQSTVEEKLFKTNRKERRDGEPESRDPPSENPLGHSFIPENRLDLAVPVLSHA